MNRNRENINMYIKINKNQHAKKMVTVIKFHPQF
jgi:hypothetical protein